MSTPAGPGDVLALIRHGRAVTRAQLMRATGLSRSTLAKRIDALIAHGYIEPLDTAASSGGRPPDTFAVNRETGVMLLAAIDTDSAQIAVCDMTRTPLGRQTFTLPLGDRRPRDADRLVALERHFDALLVQLGRRRDEVEGVGIVAPLDVEGQAIVERLATAYGCPVHVDRRVNLRAIAESRLAWPSATHLLCLDVGEAIDAALLVDGTLQRGAHGAACDIAHLPVSSAHDAGHALCRCGRHDCLEACASGRAIRLELVARGHDVGDATAIVALAQDGVRDAVEALRDAGRLLGEALAVAVNLFNPSLVVVDGTLVQQASPLLATLRESVYRCASARATRHLQIVASRLGDDAALSGAALLVGESAHAPRCVDARIAQFG